MDVEIQVENLIEHLGYSLKKTLCEMFVFYKLYLQINSKYSLHQIFEYLGYSDSKRRQFSSKLFKSWNAKEINEIENIRKNNETMMKAIINIFETH
jgi:hypothetical protein